MRFLKNAVTFLTFVCSAAIPAKAAQPVPDGRTAYDFSFESLQGEAMPLSQFRGKVLLVVNTASKCGFTPQYKGLEALYQKFAHRGLVVIGVPSNDFGGQEPGTAAEIKSFCELNYGVTFPMTGKYSVSGEAAHPFYQWTKKVLGSASVPRWNFHKYLIGRDGNLVAYFATQVKPDELKLIKAIEQALEQPIPEAPPQNAAEHNDAQ